jgi:hypothetical protein
MGGMSGEPFALLCPPEAYVTAFTGSVDDLLGRVAVTCSDGSSVATSDDAIASKGSGRPFALSARNGFVGATALSGEHAVHGISFWRADAGVAAAAAGSGGGGGAELYGHKGGKEARMICREYERVIGVHGKRSKRFKRGSVPCATYCDPASRKAGSAGAAPPKPDSLDCTSCWEDYLSCVGLVCGKPECGSRRGCEFPEPCSSGNRRDRGRGKDDCYPNPCQGCPYGKPCAPGCPGGTPAPRVPDGPQPTPPSPLIPPRESSVCTHARARV